MQLSKMIAVMDYHAQSLLCGVGKLRWISLTQAARVSRCHHSESPCSHQFPYDGVHVFVKVECYEQFAVQRCLTLGWMSSSGTLFFMMYSMISSEWSQK